MKILMFFFWIGEDDDGSEEDEELLEANMNFLRLSNDVDTTRVEEVPAKEPKPNAKPVKSALKKKGLPGTPSNGSGPSTPTQETKTINTKIDQISK